MKKIIVFTILLSFSLTSCNSQEKTNKEVAKIDSIKPKTNVRVHKEYDEYGNLISVDSTYTYFYSTIKNDSLLEKEIFDRFKIDLNSHLNPSDSIFMNDFFGDTPFNMNDFYTDDFFQNNFKLHQQRMQRIFKQMDSLKNNYYKQQKNSIKEKNKI